MKNKIFDQVMLGAFILISAGAGFGADDSTSTGTVVFSSVQSAFWQRRIDRLQVDVETLRAEVDKTFLPYEEMDLSGLRLPVQLRALEIEREDLMIQCDEMISVLQRRLDRRAKRVYGESFSQAARVYPNWSSLVDRRDELIEIRRQLEEMEVIHIDGQKRVVPQRVKTELTQFGQDFAVMNESSVIEATPDTFRQEVIEASFPVFLEVGASWCPPCMAAKPAFEELAKEYQGRIKFVSFDVDQNRELAQLLTQGGEIPLFMCFKNGQAISRDTGFSTDLNDLESKKEEIRRKLFPCLLSDQYPESGHEI